MQYFSRYKKKLFINCKLFIISVLSISIEPSLKSVEMRIF